VQLGRFWFPLKCHLEDATDEDLTCGQGWPIAMQAVTYSRGRIRTVRIAHNAALVGLVVGASAGTVIGLAQDPRAGLGRGGNAVITAALLGLFGAGVGGILSPLFPGRVVYRAPRNPTPPGPTDQSPTHPSIAPESSPAPRPAPPGSKEDFGAAPVEITPVPRK
jgi:hypothetical protein